MVIPNFSKIFLAVYLCCFLNSCSSQYIQGYYWKEFAGVVPADAFPGGVDQNGNPIYIGQILHDNKLITTKIYGNDPKGYYGLSGTEFSGTKNQKILCTQSPENFEWVRSKTDEMNLLTKHTLVLGGFEPSECYLYIGRAYYGSETSVGKVSECGTNVLGLFLSDGGKEINFKSYEILTYNESRSH